MKREMPKVRQCKHCGARFQAARKEIFCSAKCGLVFRTQLARRKPPRPCANCARPIQDSSGRFCNPGCRAAYRKARRKRATYVCRFCRVPFHATREEEVFCSAECRGRYEDRQLRIHVVREELRNNRVRRRAESVPVIARFKKECSVSGKVSCEVCGWSPPEVFRTRFGRRILHAHHVIPLASGGSDSRRNLVLLCPNHHAVAHRLGSQRQGIWYGAQTREDLLAELTVIHNNPSEWSQLRVQRLKTMKTEILSSEQRNGTNPKIRIPKQKVGASFSSDGKNS